ncbi:MAG: MMPL family transporter, partial [Planctomycetota bacterium]
MRHFFDWLAGLSVHYRVPTFLFVLAISGLSLVGYLHPEWIRIEIWSEESEDEGSRSGRDDVDPEPNVSPISLSNSDCVLVVQGEDFFTPEATVALAEIVEDLENLDQVAYVLWMGPDRVPPLNIFGLPEPLLPKPTASEKRFQRAKQKALDHPLVGGQLLSMDGKTMLMMISLNYFHVLDDSEATTLLTETARATLQRHPGVDLQVRLTGRVPSALAMIENHEKNQMKYQLFGYGMILLMSLVLFRGVRAVIIVALAPVLGVFWTIGIIQFFDYSDNPLIDVILPVLISLVGLTDGVHLMVQIRKLRAQGLDKVQAAAKGLRHVGLACLLTSLTTAIGFGSLMLADSIWVQQFGFCSMIGVLLCFISVVTVIPLGCSSWLGHNIEAGQESSLIDRNLNKIGGLITFVLNRRTPVAMLGIGLTVLCIVLSLQLRPDQRDSDQLPQSAEATQALYHVDKAFGGLEFSSIRVFWSRAVERDDAEILEVVTKVDKLLNSEELIGHPLSIRNLLDAQPGSGPLEERMTLLELLPPPLKRAFYSPERRRAIVNFRVQDLGIAAYGPTFTR